MRHYCIFLIFSICLACNSVPDRVIANDPNAVFHRLDSTTTGIYFTNKLFVQEGFDVFRYRNFYNGGGVGIADFNNDGLADVYLTSNMGDNKLFINKGNWKFEDITDDAGVKGAKVWSTGVSIADVNGDGWLDIYVCNAGDVKGGNRENELFINNGDLTFSERAAEMGLADKGFSTHAAFMDYDKDGDLDCYVLNNSYRPVSTLGYRNLRNVRDEYGGHKLYRNDDGHFNNISEEAGIYGSVIGFGLGVTVGDVNQDSWPDLYISNDFYERDYLYINNQKGGFHEELEKHMEHISMFSMGADMADLNNDSYPEIFSTDMLPEDIYRLRTLIAFETYDVYQIRKKNGYHNQFMRNMLHLNNKDGTFSEIGQLAGVAATDWSWSALIADFNNDQHKEIFVCNGIYKDVIDQDFVEYLGSSEQMKAAMEGKKIEFQEFVERMPSHKLSNYLFAKQEGWQYQNVSKSWGLAEPSFSNGSAYGDLDNDGDLDLIVNNVNQELFVYRNQSTDVHHKNFLGLVLAGEDKNRFALGSNIRAFVGDQILTYEHMPIRGFQSSMDYKIIVGLGEATTVDSLVVTWPNNKVTIKKGVQANQILNLSQADGVTIEPTVPPKVIPMFESLNTDSIGHVENAFNDFNYYRLQYHMLSTEGPAFAKADLNRDGLDDIFMGAAVGSKSAIYIQQRSAKFVELDASVFQEDLQSEDVSAVFFDADNDNDLDLVVVSGGIETALQSVNTIDRFYENVGSPTRPAFKKVQSKLPSLYESGSCVRPSDVDGDGDLDLFIGTRVTPGYYGMPCDQRLLLNDGKGNFSDATASFAPELRKLGMVTDATWFDHDSNGYPDLLVVGEWMPVTLFTNDGKKLTRQTDVTGLAMTDGWWNRVQAADLDGDGDLDFVLGNLGLNSKFRPTREAPDRLFVYDFDQNGSVEPIFTFQRHDKIYPYALRQDIIRQMASLKKKFVYFKEYGDKTVEDVVDKSLLDRSVKLSFFEPHTSVLINNGKNGFALEHLPEEGQLSPVYGIETLDADRDGDVDIILGGNFYSVKPEVGRYDALRPLLLLNDGAGNFKPVSATGSGFDLQGEVRHVVSLRGGRNSILAFVRNNNSIVFYQPKK